MVKYTTAIDYHGIFFSLCVEASHEALRQQCEDLEAVNTNAELEDSFHLCFLKMPSLLDQVLQKVLQSLLMDSCKNLKSRIKE